MPRLASTAAPFALLGPKARAIATLLGLVGLLGASACTAAPADEDSEDSQGAATDPHTSPDFFEARLANGAMLTVGTFDYSASHWTSSLVVGDVTYNGFCMPEGTVTGRERMNAAACSVFVSEKRNKLTLVLERPTKGPARVAWVGSDATAIDPATTALFRELTGSDASPTKGDRGESLASTKSIAVTASKIGAAGDSSLWFEVNQHTMTLAEELADYPKIASIWFTKKRGVIGYVSCVIKTTDKQQDFRSLDMRDPAARKQVFDDYR